MDEYSPASALYRDGRLNLFVRGNDNAIWTRWQITPNGEWSGWASIGGGCTSRPAAVLNANGGLVVFARGNDNAIWHTWQEQMDGEWSGWASLGAEWIDVNSALDAIFDGTATIDIPNLGEGVKVSQSVKLGIQFGGALDSLRITSFPPIVSDSYKTPVGDSTSTITLISGGTNLKHLSIQLTLFQ
jgi:hypothetical protein